MSSKINSSAQKVQNALSEYGVSCQVIEMPQSTRTADDAARAVGCQVGQIVKSLIFKGKESHQPILVATSGANRVNEKKIATLISEPLSKADADFVRDKTGFAIGGVPPISAKLFLHRGTVKDFLKKDEHRTSNVQHRMFNGKR